MHAFEAWGVGCRGRDDGAPLFVFADDGRARIEAGFTIVHRTVTNHGGTVEVESRARCTVSLVRLPIAGDVLEVL